MCNLALSIESICALWGIIAQNSAYYLLVLAVSDELGNKQTLTMYCFRGNPNQVFIQT